VRKLCRHCAVHTGGAEKMGSDPDFPSARQTEPNNKSGSDPVFSAAGNGHLTPEYHPVGCAHCSHTGYQGRTGVFELLVTTDAIRAQIHGKASEADIRAAALQSGMVLMRDDGERLVRSGVTSREELLRVTRD
jgi:type II secretory ATPase GspE/PulE/Tfp pilus assembly ATPase PilB-like protein